MSGGEITPQLFEREYAGAALWKRPWLPPVCHLRNSVSLERKVGRMLWIKRTGSCALVSVRGFWPRGALLVLLCMGALPTQAQVLLNPGAAGKVSFATEPITGQSAGGSTATFGTVAGYSNQLISSGHGLANLGNPTEVGNTSGSITNQTLSASASGPSPFGNGQVTFGAGVAGMGYGVLWSTYSVAGAPGTNGLVSLTRANGNGSFMNGSADPVNISAGIFFGLEGDVTGNDIAGGALAASFTVGGSTFTPYVSIAFDAGTSTGFVEPGFIGAAAPGADSTMTFTQGSGTFQGEGNILFDLLLQPGQTLDLDTTLTLFASGSAQARPGTPVGWRNRPPPPPPRPKPLETVSINSAVVTNCPKTPEPGALTLGAAMAVLVAGLFQKRCAIARQRSSSAPGVLHL